MRTNYKTTIINKKAGLTITFLVIALISTAQSWQWAKRVGSNADNATSQNGQYNEYITDVKVDKVGNVYATGWFFSGMVFNNASSLPVIAPPMDLVSAMPT